MTPGITTPVARTQAPPLALRLGEWVAGMASRPLSPGLAQKASDHLLDTLGAMVAGQDEPPAQAAREVFGRPGPVPLAGVAGLGHHGASLDPLDAAFVNAVAAHCLEIDDTEGCDHSGAVVVPVLLSLLPSCGVPDGGVPSCGVPGGGVSDGGVRTGVRPLAALVAGYEVGRRVQLALGGYDRHNARGWHSTATCGVFAAAAAASVMLGLDGGQSASALGIAASSSAGSWAFSADGSMTKQFHPGQAARAGLEAALLAQAGASGPWQVFEPVWGGFFATHGGPDGAGTDTAEPGLLVEGLGSTWHFEHSAIKPYASCRSAHTAIDAFLGILAAESLDPADVRAVRVHVNDFLCPMICPPAPADAAQARMSLPVSLALLMEGKELMPEDFRDFDSPEVLARLARIEVLRDPKNGREPLVEVVTAHGTFASRVKHARGGARHPLNPAVVEEKFRRLTADRLGSAQQAEWIAFSRGLILP